MNIYYCSIQKTMRIEAENEEEARDEFIHRFDLDYTEVKVNCEGKAPCVQPISVIEDIKAEIANMDGDINGYYVHKDDVLSVIDKYMRGKKG